MKNMFRKIKDKISRKLVQVQEEINYRNVLNIAAAMGNYYAFKDLRNCNAGKKVVLCGAGPTLKMYKSIEGCVHIALNRALLHDGISFDWFIADDWVGINFMQNEIVNYQCKKFFGRSFGVDDTIIPEDFINKCEGIKYYTDIYNVHDGFKSKFVYDIDKMAIGGMPNIALQAMQIILFTHPDQIYLAGCDATTGHFVNPKRSTEVSKEMELCVAGANSKWVELKRFVEIFYPSVRIASINPVGLKGIFEDIFTS